MPDTPTWKRRFTATQLGFPTWDVAHPERLALITNRGGSSQVWTHDLSAGSWRQVTDDPVGVESVHTAPDGRLVWWLDATGDERGHWVAAAFDGGAPEPLISGVPEAWSMGLSMVDDRVAVGLATGDRYEIYVADGDGPARLVYGHECPAGVGCEWPEGGGGLSGDGSLLCIRHGEDGDILRSALRVLDAGTGETVADLVDAGRRLDPRAWSPTESILAFVSELGAFERPALWWPMSGDRRDLTVGSLPGAVFPVTWYPDGSTLLVRHEHEGRAQLYRLDVATEDLHLVADPRGDVEESGVRPDGEVWLRASDGESPPRTATEGDREVLPNPDPPPAGTRLRDFWFDNPAGERIHAFLTTPPGDGPFPTVMSVHGGPEWHERDHFDAETQAYVDAGYAVALVNYRGSTGYGIAFRESLIGNPGFPESEDVNACLDALIVQGLADPQRVYWSGWSWGGCLACLNAGLHPDRWRAIFAGIPAGDFVAAHWASSPALRAWDVAMYGGDPEEVPDAYRERDPMSYVDRVTAPVLVIAGENDSRCPIEGVTPWVDAARANGVDVRLHLYGTGHHANADADRVRHMEMILDFFQEHGGPSAAQKPNGHVPSA
jgi:dienelactone hydrolase